MTLVAPTPTPTAQPADAPVAVDPLLERTMTVFTARVVETRGLLARIAVQLNPYDVRELELSLEDCVLRVVVEGDGFDAGRVAARLDKIVGVLEVSYR
ncbi:hypothetical protein Kfla_4877 [Kribbella flavida DSM 17836]|uniref:Uncharacterized protein n=1 Tax=Kribbella flavida (strain DSM 17836 / JCM 10339 / NBRC 14399) TaxID=479435 RepID=D2Q0U3_KRIFD|nr:hypothetical protein [Kribbella flavida]ADB33893.1 hypothetical protein Kfla_4877 [Kribbella flavida DSM 17836]